MNVSYLCVLLVVFFFKQKTAYEMRISDWSSDVCSSDLAARCFMETEAADLALRKHRPVVGVEVALGDVRHQQVPLVDQAVVQHRAAHRASGDATDGRMQCADRNAAAGDGTERKSVVQGKRGSVREDLGGRRLIKKKKKKK